MARPGFWIDFDLNTQVATAGQSNLDLLTNAEASQNRRGWTLVRTIMSFDIARAVHDSGEGSDQVNIGIGVVSEPALAVGSTALPDPGVGTEFPTRGWVFRGSYRVWGFAADQPAIYTYRVEKDLRAKRKLDNGAMVMSITNVALEGTSSTIQLTGWIRQYWLDE